MLYRTTDFDRSEEHTSELQSLRHLVCRLLLAKKNKTEENTSEPKTTRNIVYRLSLEKKLVKNKHKNYIVAKNKHLSN